jgi:hypothetical protein
MSKKYSESEIRKNIVNEISNDVSKVYSKSVVNFTGCTSDTRTLYSEIVSDELIKNFHILSSLGSGKNIRSTKPFRLATHNGKSNVSKRVQRDGNISYFEKGLAIALYNNTKTHCIGKFVDYEVPLNEKRNDGYGKIDLLAYKNGAVKLVELKINKKGVKQTDETLIRALLEIYTYYKLIQGSGSTSKFVEEYAKQHGTISSLQLAILTDRSSRSGKTMLDMSNNPCLLQLIHKIGEDVGQPVEGYLYTYANSGEPFCSDSEEMSKASITLNGKISIEKVI